MPFVQQRARAGVRADGDINASAVCYEARALVCERSMEFRTTGRRDARRNKNGSLTGDSAACSRYNTPFDEKESAISWA